MLRGKVEGNQTDPLIISFHDHETRFKITLKADLLRVVSLPAGTAKETCSDKIKKKKNDQSQIQKMRQQLKREKEIPKGMAFWNLRKCSQMSHDEQQMTRLIERERQRD